MKFPIALQLYSVRDDMAADFEGTLRKVKELGYDGVEFAGLFDKDAAFVKQLLAEIGLVAVSAHVPYYDAVDEPEKAFLPYKEIGCKFVVVPYLTPERRPGTEGYDETVAGIRKMGEAANKLGMQLLYHNHDFEFIKVDGKYALDILYDTIPSEYLQTEIDTCWVNVGGEDPADYVVKYTGKAPVVHLKDFWKSGAGTGKMYKLIGIDDNEEDNGEKTFEFRPVGYGVQDFKRILAACGTAGAFWVVVEQDEPSMDKFPLECAQMSIEYVKSLM